jgi:hypothetical protein
MRHEFQLHSFSWAAAQGLGTMYATARMTRVEVLSRAFVRLATKHSQVALRLPNWYAMPSYSAHSLSMSYVITSRLGRCAGKTCGRADSSRSLQLRQLFGKLGTSTGGLSRQEVNASQKVFRPRDDVLNNNRVSCCSALMSRTPLHHHSSCCLVPPYDEDAERAGALEPRIREYMRTSNWYAQARN